MNIGGFPVSGFFRILMFLVPFCAVAAFAQSVPAAPRPFRLVRLDPAMDALVSPDARLELLGDRFGLTEGPVWVPDDGEGFLLFSDLVSNVIYRWAPGEAISVYLEQAGYSGDDITHAGFQTRRGRMHVLMIGPNGLSLDPEGRLIYLAAPDRKVMRLEADGSRTVIAEGFNGEKFNGPNDLAISSNGTIYLTDTIWGIRDGLDNPDAGLGYSGIYMIRDGRVRMLFSDDSFLVGTPNGIALSPDEQTLYFNAGFRNVYRARVLEDGTTAKAEIFIAGEGSDGMKVDTLGNLYTTSGSGPGEVRITSPDGRRLGVIELPVPAGEPRAQVCATNIAFGDNDSRSLYITACEHVYRLRMQVAGVHPKRDATL